MFAMTRQIDNAGGELFGALAAAQAEIGGAAKNSENPHLRSQYADLASVWAACRLALASKGLCVIQRTLDTDGFVVSIETILAHKSGQWISGTTTMRPSKSDPQGYGSALTYARRYALASMVGVAPEDDDGNAASGPSETITAEEASAIRARLEAIGVDLAQFCRWAGVPAVTQIPAANRDAVVKKIEQAEAARAAA